MVVTVVGEVTLTVLPTIVVGVLVVFAAWWVERRNA